MHFQSHLTTNRRLFILRAPYISSNLCTSEPSQTRRRTSTVRPHRPCDFQVLPRRGRDTRADRAPRPNPLATRRTGAPRTPATSVGFRLIDELRAHRWGPPGPGYGATRRDAIACATRAMHADVLGAYPRLETVRAMSSPPRPRPASAGRSIASHRLGFEEPRCFFQGLRDPRDRPDSPSSAIGASREVSAACTTHRRPVRALESP